MVSDPTKWRFEIGIRLAGGKWSFFSSYSTVRVLGMSHTNKNFRKNWIKKSAYEINCIWKYLFQNRKRPSGTTFGPFGLFQWKTGTKTFKLVKIDRNWLSFSFFTIRLKPQILGWQITIKLYCIFSPKIAIFQIKYLLKCRFRSKKFWSWSRSDDLSWVIIRWRHRSSLEVIF